VKVETSRGVEPRCRGLQPRTLPLGQPVRVGTRGGNRTRFPTLRTSDPKPVDDTGEGLVGARGIKPRFPANRAGVLPLDDAPVGTPRWTRTTGLSLRRAALSVLLSYRRGNGGSGWS
jgi:hypothetical protein